MAVQKSRYGLRVEDLETMDLPEKFVEIIEGELVEMTPPPSFRHNRIASRLEQIFTRHCEQHPELDYSGDVDGFVVERNPDTYLVPDASLFRVRPGSDVWPRAFGPEIAVEVLSPSNSPSEMAFKRHRFFQAGTEQFWAVDPQRLQIEIHYRDGQVRTLTEDDTLVGEGVAEGLRVPVKEVFRQR